MLFCLIKTIFNDEKFIQKSTLNKINRTHPTRKKVHNTLMRDKPKVYLLIYEYIENGVLYILTSLPPHPLNKTKVCMYNSIYYRAFRLYQQIHA